MDRIFAGDLPLVVLVENARPELVFYLSWYNLPFEGISSFKRATPQVMRLALSDPKYKEKVS